MSDRPNDNQPDEQESSAAPPQAEPAKASDAPAGGWRAPQEGNAPGERHAWRTAGETAPPAPPPQTWRVPTLPRHLKTDQTGGWHLPKPKDTKYSPEDESVIAPPAAEAPASTEAPAPAAMTTTAAEAPAAATTPAVTEADTASQSVLP